jgi:DNA processing protein
MSGLPGVPEEALALALLRLPRLGPARLRQLLEGAGGLPSVVWTQIQRERLPGWVPAAERRRWRSDARGLDPAGELRHHAQAGIQVLVHRLSPGYPPRLQDDPDPPPVLLAKGDLEALNRPVVAVIGTRRCTGYGRQVAQMLGRELALRGVAVVSGLALGVDSAAQSAALKAGATPVVGVVASGLDHVYPESSRTLWDSLGSHGLMLSEYPLGTGPRKHSFPRRNRILAGLADVVVVVESHAAGGSMTTVQAAMDRGVTVMAVPGPVTSEASAGTNTLIAEGCPVVRDPLDVEVALGLARAGAGAGPAGGPRWRSSRVVPWADIDAADREVALLVDVVPTSMDALLGRSGMSPGKLTLALDRLVMAGAVEAGPGWWQRVGELVI